MKYTMKLFAIAAVSLIAATSAVQAKNSCAIIFDVVKIHNGPITTFDVTPSFKTPSQKNYTVGGTYTMDEAEVSPFADHVWERICYIANDRARLNDPCAVVRYKIQGGLYGWGSEQCPTFQG